MPELNKLSLSDMVRIGSSLRNVAAGLDCMESAAERVVNYFYENFRNGATGDPDCVLVRFYLTVPYSGLGPELQAFTRGLASGFDMLPSTKCMTLLATRGQEAPWNSRFTSVGHKAIPLPSVEVIMKMPMIYYLMRELGVELSAFLGQTPEVFLEMAQQNYNVFYIRSARNSPHIPAQEEFVIPYGVQSVIGFGGILPGGELFAVNFFSRQEVPRESAQMFKTVALNIKAAILRFSTGNLIFRQT